MINEKKIFLSYSGQAGVWQWSGMSSRSMTIRKVGLTWIIGSSPIMTDTKTLCSCSFFMSCLDSFFLCHVRALFLMSRSGSLFLCHARTWSGHPGMNKESIFDLDTPVGAGVWQWGGMSSPIMTVGKVGLIWIPRSSRGMTVEKRAQMNDSRE